jgi:hypothetical protein
MTRCARPHVRTRARVLRADSAGKIWPGGTLGPVALDSPMAHNVELTQGRLIASFGHRDEVDGISDLTV